MKIIVDIGGREAIPVRAIPLATDWETMWPDELADRLASGIAMTAYHLDGGAVKAIAPRWWRNETCRKLKALLTSVEAAQSSGAITEEEGALRWRNEALPLLPAGTFVWRDEFELQHIARDTSDGLDVLDKPYSGAIEIDKETVIAASEHDRNVALNLEPFIESPELHKIIMAGFDQVPAVVAGVEQSGADHRRQQFLSRVLDPEHVAMHQAAEETTEADARRVLRGDFLEPVDEPTDDPAPSEGRRPEERKAAILAGLVELGYDPLKLERVPGKAGPKAKVKARLGNKGIWIGGRVFTKAWDALRAEERIVDADPSDSKG